MTIRTQGARGRGSLVACAGLAIGASAWAGGPVFTWGSASTASWASGSNWTPFGPPNGATHTAVIDAAGPAYTVVMNLSPSLLNLSITSGNATVSMINRVLTLHGLAEVTLGSILQRNSTITGVGTTRVHSSILIEGTSTIGTALEQHGTMTIRGRTGVSTTATLSGACSNTGLIELTTIETGVPSHLTKAGAALLNSGVLRISPGTGGTRAVVGSVTNTGDVEVNAKTTFGGAGATHRNEGDWTVAPGVEMTEQATGAGGFVQASGLLDVLGAFEALNSRFRLEGGDLAGNDVVLSNSALEITAPGGMARFVLLESSTHSGNIAPTHTVTVRGQSGVNTSVAAMGPFENRGDLVFTSVGASANAEMTLGAGTILNRPGGSVLFEAGAGGLRTLGASLDNRGEVRVRQSSTIGAPGATHLNSGEVVIENSALALVGASFTNQAGGVIRGGVLLDTTGLGSFLNNGAIAPGVSVGTIAVIGSFGQGATGQLDIQIIGPGFGGSDRVSVSGMATLGGKANVMLLGGYTPDRGDAWSIVTYASGAGTMSLEAPTPADPLLRWWSEATPTSFDIGVRHIADVNHDNLVNFADVNLIIAHFNQSGAGLVGDANEDGSVDFLDLNLVVSYFNQ